MNYLWSLLATRALAQNGSVKLDLSQITGIASGESDFSKLLNDVTGLVFGFLGAAAFVGVVYSGIMMITAGGDAAKFAAGKKNLLWSIIGIVVITSAFVIIRFTLGVRDLINP